MVPAYEKYCGDCLKADPGLVQEPDYYKGKVAIIGEKDRTILKIDEDTSIASMIEANNVPATLPAHCKDTGGEIKALHVERTDDPADARKGGE